MSIETEISVADAKQAYLRWNKSQYEKLVERNDNEAYKYIQLIAFFLQLNHKLLPGYVGPDVPVGVYSYSPDKHVIAEARLLNSKFRYQQEGVIKNHAIDSVFFQQSLVESKNTCWIFYNPNLNKKNQALLNDKIKKIRQWLALKNLKIEIIFLSVDGFQKHIQTELPKTSKAIFMNRFYSEAILLAGKYPVWWLVPLQKEYEYSAYTQHIQKVRFVDNEEYIDLGGVAVKSRSEYIEYAVFLIQKIRQSPQICLVNLLLADQCNALWPQHEGIAWRIKESIYKSKAQIDPLEICVDLMREAFKKYKNHYHIMSLDRLFLYLKNTPDKLNTKIIDVYLGNDFVPVSSAYGIDHVVESLSFFKAIAHEIRQIFSNIVDGINENEALFSVTKNMLEVLSENADSVPIYNNKDKLDIVLDRILLKHEVISETQTHWSLVLEVSEGNEKTIGGFSSLLGVLAWCWLNRVVNHSTQVSINSPKQRVKQIDAYHLLELLIQKLNPRLLSNIPIEAFENPVRPLQSLLFINYKIAYFERDDLGEVEDFQSSEISRQTVIHCEQLIINSWGDVFTKQYSGDVGILQCLCEWMHSTPVNGLAKPQQLLVFGYGEGDSTYVAQRTEEIYNQIQAFFYYSKHESGRFIVKLVDDYYAITPDDFLLVPKKMGSQKKLFNYLESANYEFQETALERLAFVEHPLYEIYQSNKASVFQVFFQIINLNCHSWVIDEKGSLSVDVISLFERESYISHWLYFFSNISQRLKNINYQNKTLPSFEINQISINQLGGVEFHVIGADAVSANKHFFDIQVSIVSSESGEQLSLNCDGKLFAYKEYQNNVLIECVQYISARISGEGFKPVFVTDIDVPLGLFNVAHREDIQISHLLKFKRKFEQKLLKLLGV